MYFGIFYKLYRKNEKLQKFHIRFGQRFKTGVVIEATRWLAICEQTNDGISVYIPGMPPSGAWENTGKEAARADCRRVTRSSNSRTPNSFSGGNEGTVTGLGKYKIYKVRYSISGSGK